MHMLHLVAAQPPFPDLDGHRFCRGMVDRLKKDHVITVSTLSVVVVPLSSIRCLETCDIVDMMEIYVAIMDVVLKSVDI